MKKTNKYNGIIIGAISTVISLLLLPTGYAPLIVLMLGMSIKEAIGTGMTLVILLAIMVLSLFVIFLLSKTIEFKNIYIIIVMMIEYFIIHPLGFFIYWWFALGFKSDGQIALAIFGTYPVSSFGFLALGIFIDWIKKKNISLER